VHLSVVFDTDNPVDLSAICADWYYRRTLIWVVVRPFGWLEVLRRQQGRLDLTLRTRSVREHYRFLTACHFFEWSFSNLRIFDGIDYNPRQETAHLFYSTVRMADRTPLLLSMASRPACRTRNSCPALAGFVTRGWAHSTNCSAVWPMSPMPVISVAPVS
jgi:hypothetical protein